MGGRVKILGVIVALCASLATGPGLAQEDAPTTGRDVPRASGGADDGVANKGLVIHAGPDGSRTGAPPPLAGESRDGVVVTTNSGIDPVRPEGLQRRATIKALIANAPKMVTDSSAPNPRIGSPPVRPGVGGGAARNAIGVVVTGAGQGLGHAVPGSITSAAIGMHGPNSGVAGVGTATSNLGSADGRRPAIASNTVTGPVARTSGINGTTMGHIASGPGYIGGPAKDRSGINGTAVRPRH